MGQSGSGEINAIAQNGKALYVAQNSSNRIAVFRNGSYTGSISNSSFNHPGQVFYFKKNLYIGNNSDGFFFKLKTSGTLVYMTDLHGSAIGEAGIIPKQRQRMEK